MIDDQCEIDRLGELLDRYVSPSVASQAREQGIALGGELVHASAMFVDLYGFTALTQRLPAARVLDLLNQYYAIVERACAGEAGFIVQFLGDGVVIVFGGPLWPVDDHARRAVQAAVLLQGALAERNAGTDDERLDAGIGICTGEIIAGHVGTGERVTYTIVGDAVNQAARLQAKTRDCDASILLTASTRAAMGSPEDVPLRACGATMLKGLTAAVEIFAVELS